MTFTPTPARPGVTWTKTDGANVLFPNMSAPTLIRPWDHKHQTLFAGPTVVLGGGRRYASASPRQFCLFPYPYAANVTSAEDGNLLLLREVGPGAALGPVFWASSKVPAGFEAATAQAGIRTSAQMGAAARADLALLAERGRLPCDVRNGTTKCEACANGCGATTACERTHYDVPAGVGEDLERTRDHSCSAAPQVHGCAVR